MTRKIVGALCLAASLGVTSVGCGGPEFDEGSADDNVGTSQQALMAPHRSDAAGHLTRIRRQAYQVADPNVPNYFQPNRLKYDVTLGELPSGGPGGMTRMDGDSAEISRDEMAQMLQDMAGSQQ